MNIRERVPGDVKELKRRIRKEKDADRRDRLRAVVWAIRGMEVEDIAEGLGRSRRQCQDWAYAYRDGGMDAIHPPKRKGKTPRVTGVIAARLKARLDAGPTESDKVCTLRGEDVRRILREEEGVELSLNATYATLHRMGYRCLAPRPPREAGPGGAGEVQVRVSRGAPVIVLGDAAEAPLTVNRTVGITGFDLSGCVHKLDAAGHHAGRGQPEVDAGCAGKLERVRHRLRQLAKRRGWGRAHLRLDGTPDPRRSQHGQ